MQGGEHLAETGIAGAGGLTKRAIVPCKKERPKVFEVFIIIDYCLPGIRGLYNGAEK